MNIRPNRLIPGDPIPTDWGGGSLSSRVAVQSLWSGYGTIERWGVSGGDRESLIVKEVRPPREPEQPRGWNTAGSHRRKLRSYGIEAAWYGRWARRLPGECRVPETLAVGPVDDGWRFVFEDLDAAGFPRRLATVGTVPDRDVDAVLGWLAEFHAAFLGVAPEGLWPVGTYWHLGTRRDEFDALAVDDPIRRRAEPWDRMLRGCPYQTLVHGDAKVANFCFPESPGGGVAAVDFQYVGGGVGVKDVAYFLGSCYDERQLCRRADGWLDVYFDRLAAALRRREVAIEPVVSAWRRLYPVAWADFARFLAGWCPGHAKMHGYTAAMVRHAEVIVE